MYRTDIATENDLKDWNNVISDCPYSEALHTVEWRDALGRCFKQLEPLYLTIKDDSDSIVGALPCFIFQPIPLSRTLLSMQWTLPGGPLLLPEANVIKRNEGSKGMECSVRLKLTVPNRTRLSLMHSMLHRPDVLQSSLS